MLDMYVTVDDKYQYFESLRKYNHNAIEPTSNNNVFEQVPLRSDTLQYKQYNTTNIPHHKVPLPGNEYIYFKLTEYLPEQHSVKKLGIHEGC